MKKLARDGVSFTAMKTSPYLLYSLSRSSVAFMGSRPECRRTIFYRARKFSLYNTTVDRSKVNKDLLIFRSSPSTNAEPSGWSRW